MSYSSPPTVLLVPSPSFFLRYHSLARTRVINISRAPALLSTATCPCRCADAITQRHRRIVILDCLLTWAAGVIRLDLGRWASRRAHVIRQKEFAAAQQLRTNGHPEALVREQWALQQAAQTSMRKSTHRRVAFAPCLYSSRLPYIRDICRPKPRAAGHSGHAA